MDRGSAGRVSRLVSRPVILTILLLGAVAAGLALWWFQPWKLWIDETVDEPAPAAARTTLATGRFISQEHTTRGTVRILRSAGGSLVLRLENLDTSNGPDLHVWLTDAPVRADSDFWHVFDNGPHLNAGDLKGNRGSQNYPLPPGTDLARYSSVSIWCDRFDVSFGAAALSRR